MNGSTERWGYLKLPSEASLFARVYLPRGGSLRSPVVIVPPDGEERTWSQRTLVNLARYVANAGHPVVRFDFRGQGESDGAFEDTSIPSRVEDLEAAVGLARRTFGVEPALVGFRLGANLAAHAVDSGRCRPPRVVLVEPVETTRGYITELLRKNLANQLVFYKKVVSNRKQLLEQVQAGSPVSCNGFLLATPFLDTLPSLPGLDSIAKMPDVVLLRISADGPNQAAETIPPFWVEGPTFRSCPTRLFQAVERELGGTVATDARDPDLLVEAPCGRRVVELDGATGRLAATWHPGEPARTGFVFLNPGPNDRAGPHGLYGRLATRLSAEGHAVLRVDAIGTGESEGVDAPLQDCPISEVYRKINDGAHVPAALAGLDWCAQAGIRDLVLFGLCGGASTAGIATGNARDLRVRLVLAGMPILHQGFEEEQVLTEEHVRDELAVMRRKLVRPEALLRFATLRSEYRVLWRVLRERARQLVSRGRAGGEDPSGAPLHPQTNRVFLEVWERFSAGGGRTTFVFSEHDRLFGLFREHFAPLVREGRLPDVAEIVVLEGTNHNVTNREAEIHLLRHLLTAARETGYRAPTSPAAAGGDGSSLP